MRQRSNKTYMIIKWWHSLLKMPRFDLQWHLQDLADEVKEYEEASGFLNLWSELSDVVYTCTRGQWSGHRIKFPYSISKFILGSIYMFPKYTIRWLFFRRAAKRIDPKSDMRAVRNPRKVHKCHQMAEEFGLDPVKFEKECSKMLKYWWIPR